jgi:hypothetical protein
MAIVCSDSRLIRWWGSAEYPTSVPRSAKMRAAWSPVTCRNSRSLGANDLTEATIRRYRDGVSG